MVGLDSEFEVEQVPEFCEAPEAETCGKDSYRGAHNGEGGWRSGSERCNAGAAAVEQTEGRGDFHEGRGTYYALGVPVSTDSRRIAMSAYLGQHCANLYRLLKPGLDHQFVTSDWRIRRCHRFVVGHRGCNSERIVEIHDTVHVLEVEWAIEP